MVSNHLALPSVVRKVIIPPPSLQGRVAGLRLRARELDILIIGFYVPPRMSMQRHRSLGREIATWIAAQIAAAGTRTLPLVAGDLNDGIGLVRGATGRWETAELCGNFGQRETGAGTFFREALARQHMKACLCEVPLAPTYHSHHGTGSWIDHWFVPTSKTFSLLALQRSMARLQTITSTAPRDHCPIRLHIDTIVWHPPEATAKNDTLDRDAIMKAYLSSRLRTPFVEAVEEKMLAEGWYDKWRSCMNDDAPDDSWRLMVKTISEAALVVFPPAPKKKEDEYTELARQRQSLLKERAQHRQDLRGTDEDTAAGLQLELVMISRRARK